LKKNKTLAKIFFFAKNKVGLEIKKEKNQEQSKSQNDEHGRK
jgi:hypothetical protein